MGMDPTTAAGVAVAVSKLAFFALLIHASRRATRAAREAEAARAVSDRAAPDPETPPVPAPVREAA